MKVIIKEYDGCFGMDFTAETLEEATILVRMGMLGTKDLRINHTYVNRDTSMQSSIVIGKRINSSNIVPNQNKT